MFFIDKGYNVVSTQVTKISDGESMGIVEFESPNEVHHCLNRLAGFEYLGRKLELRPYFPEPERVVQQPEPSSLVEEEKQMENSFEEIKSYPSKFEAQDAVEVTEDFEKY